MKLLLTLPEHVLGRRCNKAHKPQAFSYGPKLAADLVLQNYFLTFFCFSRQRKESRRQETLKTDCFFLLLILSSGGMTIKISSKAKMPLTVSEIKQLQATLQRARVA